MRRLLLPALLMLVAAPALAVSQEPPQPTPAPAGTEFKAIDGNFKVEFPGSITYEPTQQPTAKADVKMTVHTYYAQDAQGNLYVIAHQDLPAEAIEGKEISQILGTTRLGILQGMKGKARSEDAPGIGKGTGGVRFEFDGTFGTDAVVGNWQLWYLHGRMYSVAVLAKTEMNDDMKAKIQKFHKSFSLLKDAQPKTPAPAAQPSNPAPSVEQTAVK